MADQAELFNASLYDDGRKKRKDPQRHTNKGAYTEPHEHPWMLMTNRAGAVTWHLPKVSNKHGSIIAWCGFIGRPIFPFPDRMVRCLECVDAAPAV